MDKQFKKLSRQQLQILYDVIKFSNYNKTFSIEKLEELLNNFNVLTEKNEEQKWMKELLKY